MKGMPLAAAWDRYCSVQVNRGKKSEDSKGSEGRVGERGQPHSILSW